MTAFVNKMKFTVRNQPVEFFAYKRRGYGIIIPPDKQSGLFDIAELFAKIMTYGALGQSNDLNNLDPVIGDLKHFVYQFFCSHGRIIKSKLRFFADILFISTLGISIAHAVFK